MSTVRAGNRGYIRPSVEKGPKTSSRCTLAFWSLGEGPEQDTSLAKLGVSETARRER